MSEHHIVAVSPAIAEGCSQCGPTTPHNVSVRCGCRTEAPLMIACGVRPHIWTLTRHEDGTASLSPSFDWLNDPRDASKGSHVHEFVARVPVVGIAQLHGVA